MNSTEHPTDDVSPTKPSYPTPTNEAATRASAASSVPQGQPPAQMRMLTEDDLHSPRQRRVRLPLVLFLITCISTFWAGATDWSGLAGTPMHGGLMEVRIAIVGGWSQGLIYMACVLAILLTHEMGHFIATECYRIPASLPYFIPFPISPIGTMGAVIGMEGFKANRRQMFDIGLAGPLAGLVVAIPILWIGIQRLDLSTRGFGAMAFDCPWLVRLLIGYLKPEFRQTEHIWLSQLNPFFMAGWVGLLITGLNMLPVSQLDGGHVIYTLFLKRAHWIARAFLLLSMTLVVIFDAYMWTVMLVIVTLIGTDHPRTSNDHMKLGWFRLALGYTSLLIPVLCFPPRAFVIPN